MLFKNEKSFKDRLDIMKWKMRSSYASPSPTKISRKSESPFERAYLSPIESRIHLTWILSRKEKTNLALAFRKWKNVHDKPLTKSKALSRALDKLEWTIMNKEFRVSTKTKDAISSVSEGPRRKQWMKPKAFKANNLHSHALSMAEQYNESHS